LKKDAQQGVQMHVLEAIKDSKKMGFKCITKQEIINQVQQKGFNLNKPEEQVGQALYQLQRKTKFREPRIKKFKTEEKKGWTVINEEDVWKN